MSVQEHKLPLANHTEQPSDRGHISDEVITMKSLPHKELMSHETSLRDKFKYIAALGRTPRPSRDIIYTLNKVLLDESALVRKFTAITLAHIGPAASMATINLINCLKDPCAEVRAQAAHAIGEIKSSSDYISNALCDSLIDDDALVRWRVALALGELNTASIRITLSLENALSDNNHLVRTAARQSICKLHNKKKPRFNPQFII